MNCSKKAHHLPSLAQTLLTEIKRLAKALVATFFTILVTLLCALGSLIQLLCLPLEFFSPGSYYKLNSNLAFIVWRVLLWVFENFSGIRLLMTPQTQRLIRDAKANRHQESAIVICNHRSASDWYFIHAVAHRLNLLGYQRYFVKQAVTYFPIFGLAMKLMGQIFLRRDWLRDEKKIAKVFERYAHPASQSHPVWIVCFPEGSRFCPMKKEKSDKFCKAEGLPVLSNVLMPRTKGFVASVQQLRASPNVKYLYDFTVACKHDVLGFGNPPTIFDVNFKGDASEYVAVVDVRKYLLDDLPRTDTELAIWLQNVYQQKDSYLNSIKTDSHFFRKGE